MKPLSEEEIEEGWIDYRGVCPVAPECMVQVKCDDDLDGGGESKQIEKADDVHWGDNLESTVYAYRVVDQGEALKAAVDAGVDKLESAHMAGQADAGIDPSYSNARNYAQDKAMGDDKPAKDLRQLGRFSHHDTEYTTHVFYDEHPIAMITDDVISWSYHMPDMKKAASEAMHVYLGRVWK